MISRRKRVAFFPDSYLEINGAAMTCRRLTDHAEANGYEMACFFGDKEASERRNGSVKYLGLKRSKLAIAMDEDLAFDPLFFRHFRKTIDDLEQFRPDVIHITGLNDMSILGALAAHRLDLPMIASWHTNLHEFAASRIKRKLRRLPENLVSWIANTCESRILDGTMLYYQMPQLILAPNAELQEALEIRTGRATRSMIRGVDSNQFSPVRRTVADDIFRIGFVGRLRAEKKVGLLIDLEKELKERGLTGFEFLIVGDGDMRRELETGLGNAVFTGYLDGDALSEAYSNMDVFVFPSESDAFGNVIQEANASGVPAIVSGKGGPKFIVEHGRTGFVAESPAEYADYVEMLLLNPDKLEVMKENSREFALDRSWDTVFESVWASYDECVQIAKERKANKAAAASMPVGHVGGVTAERT